MTTPFTFPAALGFAAVVVWAALGLGWALLALSGAALFALGAALLTGRVSTGELRERLDGARAGFATPRRGR